MVLCGQMCSGKSTTAGYLSTKFGLQIVSFGDYVRSAAAGVSGGMTREALQDLGRHLIESDGYSGFLKSAMAHAGVEVCGSVVFDGVRHDEILANIRKWSASSVAVYLRAGLVERHRRYGVRQGPKLSIERFKHLETHPVEAGVQRIARECDVVIDAGIPIDEVYRVLSERLAPAFAE